MLNTINNLNNTIDLSNESITVTQLNKLAKSLLENNMPIFWIQGEISGLKTYSHVYFDLKDESAKISCVLFANILTSLNFKLENGMKIEVRGKVTLYPQNGSYQINVERVRQVGMGELWEAYHRLLNKLKLEGLFDSHYKKPIPIFPSAIGVITSKEGAVIRDVITTLKRRMPNIPIIIYHTSVQGSDASMQITKAIQLANQRREVDVLIICRGGGSMQDLWCFNQEVVAREVFNSYIPIISAVGHETDTTIIDYVSDLRAPTPTGAAELVAKSRDEWLYQLDGLHIRLNKLIQDKINNIWQNIDICFRQLRLLSPINQLKNKIIKINHYYQRLNSAIEHKLIKNQLVLNSLVGKLHLKNLRINDKKISISLLSKRINMAMYNKATQSINKLDSIKKYLELVNPHNILDRGYAIILDKSGCVVSSSNNVIHNQKLEIVFKDSKLNVFVDKKHQLKQSELI
jgi:exodeoxyribonuclease VII large subunit